MRQSAAENEPPQAGSGKAARWLLVYVCAALGCSTDPPVRECSPELPSIQQAVFVPKCSEAGCHGGTEPAAALDLTMPALAARLVEVPAALCDRTLVVPGVPEQSYLWEKIASAEPTCGAHMPIDGELPSQELSCVKGWIESMPSGCETCGGGGCVDLATTEAHCGACNSPCPTGAACEGGQCACAQGVVCGGGCVIAATDPAHCGGCGNACGSSQVCNKGACATGCDADLTQCGASCIDSTSDAANCGRCGSSCGIGGSCIASACSCGDGIDVQTDPENCGSCGRVCAPGETCTAGECACNAAAVSFSADVQPIFAASCASAGCHKGTTGMSNLDLTAGNAYDALVGVPAGQCDDGRHLVVAGEPSDSYLVDKLLGVDLCAGTQMPKSGALSTAEIATIVAWVCGGAAND